MHMIRGVSLVLVAAAALWSSQAGAAVLMNENFNYGSSNLSSGYGAWQDGTGRVGYVAENLPFSAVGYTADNPDTTGALAANGGSGSPRGAQVNFSASPVGGTLWMSVLMKVTASAGTGRELVVAPNSESGYSYGNPGGSQVGLGYDADGKLATVLRTGDVSSFGTASLSENDTVLLVAKMTIGAGADSASLWVFDDGASLGSTEASLGAPDLTSTTADWGDGVSNLWAGRYDSGMSGRIDAIRLSDSAGDQGLTDVLTPVPEPASLLILGGLGVAGLIRRRRN